MSYRKLTIDGKEYEYTIGRTHTKIKGLGAFTNEEIGVRYVTDGIDAEKQLANPELKLGKLKVKPSHVIGKIIGEEFTKVQIVPDDDYGDDYLY